MSSPNGSWPSVGPGRPRVGTGNLGFFVDNDRWPVGGSCSGASSVDGSPGGIGRLTGAGDVDAERRGVLAVPDDYVVAQFSVGSSRSDRSDLLRDARAPVSKALLVHRRCRQEILAEA